MNLLDDEDWLERTYLPEQPGNASGSTADPRRRRRADPRGGCRGTARLGWAHNQAQMRPDAPGHFKQAALRSSAGRKMMQPTRFETSVSSFQNLQATMGAAFRAMSASSLA